MKTQRFIFLILALNFSFIITFPFASGNDHLQKNPTQFLPSQKQLIIQVLPGVTKKLQINRQQLAKYVTHENKQKIMKNFHLQYKNILRTAEIHIAVFSNKSQNEKNEPFVQHLNKDLVFQQSTVFSLQFLSNHQFDQIFKIQLEIKSKAFSILALTLINNQISDQIDLHHSVGKLGTIPVWMPQSYDAQTEKSKQITKYFYFKASQNPTKLRINRLKGHPKIFLYNCQINKTSFCRQQIDQQHVEGTLMLQKQLQVTLQKQPKCKDCHVILALKNMGAQTKMEISQHRIHDSLILAKDNPVHYGLKTKQSLEVTSYFSFPYKPQSNPYFLDLSFIEGDQNSLKVEFVSILSLENQLSQQNQKLLEASDLSSLFQLSKKSSALRIRLNNGSDLSKYLKLKDSNNETWYKINVKFTALKDVDFTIVDRNIPLGQENYITLHDGQILHSYIFSQFVQQKSNQNQVQNFKVKVSSISVLTVSCLCSQINKMTIQYSPQPNDSANNSYITTKINPKVFVENITHHNKKCSQLIHLNPMQLFDQTKKQSSKQFNQGWVYLKISGVNTEVDLLYSSSDIISLEKKFPYHSQLQYNQALHFHVPKLHKQARIKIQKCSDCQITLSFSQQQLADLSIKRTHSIINKDLKQINNVYFYQMKDQNGLFIKVKTNNFAHFAIVVEDFSQENKELSNSNQFSEINNKIRFSLQQNNTLTLQFSPPTFFYTNDLNSPTYFSLIEGSINNQVSRQVYCPQFIYSQKQRTRDISITKIQPQLIHDEKGNQRLVFSLEVKHHDFFGIRAQKGDEIFSYVVVNIESMKTFSFYRWSIFNVALFVTFTLFMSFVCFMGLKTNKIKKVGGQVVMQSEQGQQTSMVRLN